MLKTGVSNLTLHEDVAAELAFDPSVDAAKIGVAAQDGIITLTGTVASYSEKIAAERIARRVNGVKGIACEISVDLLMPHQRSDADIAAAAANIFMWDAWAPRDAIKVTVQRGWITLDGEVSWQFQKQHAGTIVHNLMGVRGVSNNIQLKMSPPLGEVREQIKKALERSADLEAQGLSIDEQGGKVTIRGRVHCWTEHDSVTRIAYSVPGVQEVENLTVITDDLD